MTNESEKVSGAAERVSEQMYRVLLNISNGEPVGQHLRGQSEHGGHVRVMSALFRRGLVRHDDSITEAGREALQNHGYRSRPNCEGWWLWKEAGRGKPERLLIVGGGKHFEVATDDDVSQALGRKIDEAENYWEMTDVKQMPGTWKFDGAQTL